MTVTTAGARWLRGNPEPECPLPETGPAPRTLGQKLARCASVSVISTTISIGTLTVATLGLGMTAWIANVVAVCVATFPSYTLNRRWTWGVTGTSDFRRQVAPFWGMALAGLLLSTAAVEVTDASGLAASMPTPLLATGAVLAAHLSGWAVLWVVQFVVLDRLLFADR
jgi:putative flippase GtrA